MVLKTAVKRKMHYPFKWIQLNVNVKIGWCILKNCSHSRARFEHVFLKKYIKSGNITGKKNKT